MSMNLAELGRVICQDFDQRVLELNTIHSEIRTKIINSRKELAKLAEVDRTNLREARTQIWETTGSLLDKYREDRKTMVDGLRADKSKLIDEMKTWIMEWKEDLRGWYEAGGYLVRKRTGR